jgi:magnesium transporter
MPKPRFLPSDWLNYALIDDITDGFMPILRFIELEVDAIDELVLILKESEQVRRTFTLASSFNVPTNLVGFFFFFFFFNRFGVEFNHQSDMLRRIGHSRKRVMLLTRLLITKADVLKAVIKRCAEKLAPESDTTLYLGDIQGEFPPTNPPLPLPAILLTTTCICFFVF